MPERTCSVDGCTRVHNARGLCKRHYSQQPDQAEKAKRYERARRESDPARQEAERQRNRRRRGYQQAWADSRKDWGSWWERERATEDNADLRAQTERRARRQQRIDEATKPLPGPRHWIAGTCAGPGCREPLVFGRRGRWKDADASYCRPCRKRRWGGGHRQRARYFGVPYEPINHFEVFKADDHRCQLCHRKATGKYPHPRSPSLDHIIPLALGGPHLRHNVQTACLECNVKKGTNPANDQLRLDVTGVAHL